MTIKLLEIRDRGTCISALAVHLRNRTPREFALLQHAGWSAEQIGGPEDRTEPAILLMRADGGRVEYDPYAWGDRTWSVAHHHLIAHWPDITSGDLLDVRVILGETDTPCETDMRLSHA